MSRPGRRIPSVVTLLLCVFFVSACQAPPPMGSDGAGWLPLTLENINTVGSGVSAVALSPDGSTVAFVADAEEGRSVYLVPARGGSPRFLHAGSSPVWAPNGQSLAVISGGSLLLVSADEGATPTQLIDGMSGVRDPSFAPDGSRLAFYSTDSGFQDIWVVDAVAGAPARQLTRSAMAEDDPRFTPAWSPDGTRIAYLSNAVDYWRDDLFEVDVATQATRQLTRSLMMSSTPVWSPDGSRIALFGTARDEYWYQDLAYLYVLDPARPGSERPLEMQVYATDAIMSNRPFWSGDGSFLYFPYQERGNYDLWSVPATGGVATRVSNLGGSMRSFDASAGADRFAFVRSGPTTGAEGWTLDAVGGPALQVTDVAPRFEGLRAPHEVSFRSFDGLYVQGFMYLPPEGKVAQRCPALVQVHGGGTNSYTQGLNLTEQYLASKGFVVLAINYRGGSGFGREFQDLAVHDWLGDQARDAGEAARFLRTLPQVNGKVGIYGGSYGGSMSLAAATLVPDAFDAVVPMRGAYTKSATFDETDRLGKIFTVTGHGAFPTESPEAYRVSNTIDRLDRLQAPALLMHGEEDRRVPFLHFQLAVAELERLGKTFETKSYPGEGHGFRNPANRIDMYQRLEEFFRRQLGACGA